MSLDNIVQFCHLKVNLCLLQKEGNSGNKKIGYRTLNAQESLNDFSTF